MKRFFSGPVVKKTAAVLVVLVISYFLGTQLYRGWKDIPFSSLQFNYFWLVFSYLGLFASFACSIKAWQIILEGLGSKMSFTRSWWVITASFLAKYIPGHVWAVGGRMILCKAEGVSEKVSGTAMIIEMMGLLLGSLLAGIAGIPFLLTQGVPSWIGFAGSVVLSFAFLSLALVGQSIPEEGGGPGRQPRQVRCGSVVVFYFRPDPGGGILLLDPGHISHQP
jgi:uncharacterized membrane protein YbhN (UPF0104 family)